MADYSNTKRPPGALYPDRASDATTWSRVEPLITADQLRRRQLLGIPLVSFFPDPITGKRIEVTNEDLSDAINRAVANIELETGLTIFPVQYDEKHPFDRNYWDSYGFIKVEHRPVTSVEKLAFTPATGNDIFTINPDWIEPANFHKGQINIIPFVPAVATSFVAAGSSAGASGFAYIQLLQYTTWVPALVRTTYTAGFPGGQIPRSLNEIIGIEASLEILSLLAATFRTASSSLNIDGMGQSVSHALPLYQARIQYLIEKKTELVSRIKAIYGLNIFSSYI